MPLWDYGDLLTAYVPTDTLFLSLMLMRPPRVKLDDRYEVLKNVLQKQLILNDPAVLNEHSVVVQSQVTHALRVLYLQRSFSGAVATDIDDAIEGLVKQAILEYGSAARDVVEAIYAPNAAEYNHQSVEDTTYEDLHIVVRAIRNNWMLASPISHTIIAVTRQEPSPDRLSCDNDLINIDFKSIRIGETFMEAMLIRDQEKILDMFNLFRSSPESAALARWAF